MNIDEIVKRLEEDWANSLFQQLYPSDQLQDQKKRWKALAQKHRTLFGEQNTSLYTTPGRTELGGNHTDHNGGCVLAASVNLDTIGAVSLRDDSRVIFHSEGYPVVDVDLKDLSPRKAEEGKTEALIRGIAAGFAESGYRIGGFQINTTSSVLKGSGLSSSAALEILTASILNTEFNDRKLTSLDMALIGQEAENLYFGKPCGLMDQIACACGGITAMDFKSEKAPEIRPVLFDFHEAGYDLMVVDTGGNHADLTPEYGAVPGEMKAAAQFCGGEVCRDISKQDLLAHIKDLRRETGDRAILRAFHFYKENERVEAMLNALHAGQIKNYLALVNASGRSSFCYLQNVYPAGTPREQGISLALALTEDFLAGEGACRVHGGGFAGTIQVYVPLDKSHAYHSYMEDFFGQGAVTALKIRPLPSMRVPE